MKKFRDIAPYLVAFLLGAAAAAWYMWPEPTPDRIQELEEQVLQYEIERDSIMDQVKARDYEILTLHDTIAYRDMQLDSVQDQRLKDKKYYEKKLKDIDLIPDDSLQSEFDRLYPSRSN